MVLNFAALWDMVGLIEIKEGCGVNDADREVGESSYLSCAVSSRILGAKMLKNLLSLCNKLIFPFLIR